MKRIHHAGLALALLLTASAAWAKLPSAPPMDPAAKAAADEKKAAAAAAATTALAAAQDRAVQNYQANMKKAGKPIPKPVPVAAAAPAPAKPGDAKAAGAKPPEKNAPAKKS